MKRLFVSLVILLLLASLLVSACGTKTPTTTTPALTTPAQTTQAATTTAPPRTSTSAVTTPPVTTTTLPVTTTPPVTSPAAGQPRYGGTLNLLHNGGLPTLGSVAEAGNLMQLRNTQPVFENLLRLDADQKIVPWLAESFDTSADGKTITFRLRRGVKFHDGTDFNAEAVKYNLEQVVAGGIRGSAVLKKVTSYDIVDPYTLRMNLSQYDATLLIRLASTNLGQMVSPAAMKKATTPDNQARDHMVGTGPFLFDTWQRDNYVRFKKNPNYWVQGKPYLDAIQVNNIADLTVSIMAFKSGVGQALQNPDPVDAKQLEKDGFAISQPPLYFYHSFMTDGNNPKSPFADKRVRQALEYAIDRKTMALGIGQGYYEALYQGAAKNASWYNSALAPREYDPAKAKALLAEAGFPGGLKTKIVSDVRVRKDTLVAVQTYLKAVGITADLDIADVARASTLPLQGWEGILFPGFPTAGNFLGLVGRYALANDYVSFYRPQGWQTKWDALLAEVNDASREAQFKEMIKIMYDESNVTFYQADAPLLVMQPATVNSFQWHTNLAADVYYPENVWLSK